VRPGPRLTEENCQDGVAGVNLTPSMGSGTQNVRLQLSADNRGADGKSGLMRMCGKC